MKTLAWICSFLVFFISSHVIIEHGGISAILSNHNQNHIEEHHFKHIAHITYHHDHTDQEHSHPKYTRNHQQNLPTIVGISFIDVNSVLSFVPTAKETKQIYFRYFDLPPPAIVPIYVNNCSFLI